MVAVCSYCDWTSDKVFSVHADWRYDIGDALVAADCLLGCAHLGKDSSKHFACRALELEMLLQVVAAPGLVHTDLAPCCVLFCYESRI